MSEQARLLEVMRSGRYASEFTHHFYRYPAAASPEVIREVIARFSSPGDLVFDPFMGGGTTAVEALALGRRCIGSDINSLAVFSARAKTTPLSAPAWDALHGWAADPATLRYERQHRAEDPRSDLPRRLQRAVASGLATHRVLQSSDQRLMARCAILRIAQWALESRDELPTNAEFRNRLRAQLRYMERGSTALFDSAHKNGLPQAQARGSRRFLKKRVQDLDSLAESHLPGGAPARLVLTSPPYPGVHVLYHRWQIEGRRETSAPYWIINRSDGLPPRFYTMGSRTPHGEDQYFLQLTEAFQAIRHLVAEDCLIVQIVAFSDPTRQLPRFRQSMENAGYTMEGPDGADEVKLVRQVPNRRWYARGKESSGSRELLLFARPA